MTLFRILIFTIHYVSRFMHTTILKIVLVFSFLLILCLLPCYIVELNIIFISIFL